MKLAVAGLLRLECKFVGKTTFCGENGFFFAHNVLFKRDDQLTEMSSSNNPGNIRILGVFVCSTFLGFLKANLL